MQGICDIQNISYFVDSKKIAEPCENIHFVKRKQKYQMFFSENK